MKLVRRSGLPAATAGAAGDNDQSAGRDREIAPTEWLLLALIVAVGAYLRFSHLDLLEFQSDEAFAAQLALEFVKHGKLPLAGLMSSVGVTNPPLFSYLLIPMFAISENPVVVSCCIALTGLAAVLITWQIGRKYYGPVTGLVAAAFFAVSPWAVIYSRKIWAQDFVPIFAAGTMWAVHAVCLGNRPKAIFWCVLLPICVIQIHFSGIALTAAVIAILAWWRPKMDWRWAVAGLAVAVVTLIPYLKFQQAHDWADIRQAMKTVGGGQQWEQLRGATTHPLTGYRLPSKQNFSYALAIMNAGRIEDVLGIAAGKQFDLAGVWGRSRQYFTSPVGPVLWLQRLAFVAALVWLVIAAARKKDWKNPTWILALWFVVPVVVFYVAGLWTYLTYFAILWPAHFLVCGALGQRALPGKLTAALAGVFVAANVWFMLDYYRFVERYGGAQGTFGTALGLKQQAARYLAEQGGARLREESQLQLALAMARSRQEQAAIAQKLQQPMLIELNHEGRPELPQLEWPLLITQAGAGRDREVAPAATIVLVDGNREALRPEQWQQLAQYPGTNFGPIKLFFVKQ